MGSPVPVSRCGASPGSMQIDLSGHVVLVTGASRGIGRAIATGLADTGATVAVHCNKNQASAIALAKELGHNAQAFQADLANVDECVALFNTVLSAYGRLDVLINNAGVGIMTALDAPVSEWQTAWDRTLVVNARATALLCRLALQHFVPRGAGRIVNVASRAAFRGDTADLATYAASKGAVVSLTRSIARAYGKKGVTAFVVAPGFVRTDMAQKSIEMYGESFVLDDLALSRLTEPADLVPIITLLASGLADHATGATIDINAGSYVH